MSWSDDYAQTLLADCASRALPSRVGGHFSGQRLRAV